MSTLLSRSARRGALAVPLAVLLAAAAVPASADFDTIPLNVGQETTGSHTGASGSFSYTIDGDQLCYTLSARNLSQPALAAHIHQGPRKVAAPIVVPLTVGAGTTFEVSACTTADPALLASIDTSPRDFYVNVHTPTFPGGEIRGQLTH